VVRTGVRTTRANAFAGRWVGTVRCECLDWLLIAGERHLLRVLREYADHYNRSRPHRALRLLAPLARAQPASPAAAVVRRDRVSGLIHEIEPVAA
jgi:putative transposase